MEEEPLDSEDDAEDGDELVTVEQAMPSGMKVGLPPPAEVLEYKGERASELVEREILFNWAGTGWAAGRITKANTDGRRKIKLGNKMVIPNDWAWYRIDEMEADHALSLETYGIKELHENGQWVLLEACS